MKIHNAILLLFGLCSMTISSVSAQSPPFTFNWPDRRPIGMDVFATDTYSTTNNPRGWFSGVTTTDYSSDSNGMANFAAAMIKRTTNEIHILTNMNAQGVILWTIEGQETNIHMGYIGDPRCIPLMAPEMDAVADQVFALYRNAGLKVGITLRAHTFGFGTNLPSAGTNGNEFILTSAPFGQKTYYYTNGWVQEPFNYAMDIFNCTANSYWPELGEKIAYAQARWGCTLFYIDSFVELDNFGQASTAALSNVANAYPGVLLAPELNVEANRATNIFAFSAPYMNPIYTGYSVPTNVPAIYPKAAGLIVINPPYTNNALLAASIRAGNIMVVQSWYPNAGATVVNQTYFKAALQPPSNLHIINTDAP
jgi:hypothetical protein